MSDGIAGHLDGKRVLVTGASRGLGAAIAARLVTEGARVIAGVRQAPTARGPTDHDVVPLDTADERSVCQAFEWIDRRHGGLDVLVNNAGVAVFKPVGDL